MLFLLPLASLFSNGLRLRAKRKEIGDETEEADDVQQ
jgi:hypothetical protein